LGNPVELLRTGLRGLDKDVSKIATIRTIANSLCGLGPSMTNKIAATIWTIEDVF